MNEQLVYRIHAGKGSPLPTTLSYQFRLFKHDVAFKQQTVSLSLSLSYFHTHTHTLVGRTYWIVTYVFELHLHHWKMGVIMPAMSPVRCEDLMGDK